VRYRLKVMAQLDRLKEEIGHLKLWEGIAVVIGTGLAGWLISTADEATPLTFGLAVGGVAFMGVGILRMFRQVERRIDEMGKL